MLTDTSITSTLRLATQRLAEVGCATPQLDAEVLLAHTLNTDRGRLYLKPETQLNPVQLATYFELIARREQREPVAYIVGHQQFFALDFFVNRHVLIPRPETELLVEKAIAVVAGSNDLLVEGGTDERLSIADVGTGSGCIAVALVTNITHATVFASDVSRQAVVLARQNAVRHGVAGRIHFFIGDLLSPIGSTFDIIVSNPPYVSQLELQDPGPVPEVNQYEPRLALDGGSDGLSVIRRLMSQAKEKLRSNGSLLMEIGSGQAKAVLDEAKVYFPSASIWIKKDLAGLDRLLVVRNQAASEL